MSTGEEPRRSLAEEAAELVEAVKVWSTSPEVRAQLATATASLLEAGAALLDAVADRHRATEAGGGDTTPTSDPRDPDASDDPRAT